MTLSQHGLGRYQRLQWRGYHDLLMVAMVVDSFGITWQILFWHLLYQVVKAPRAFFALINGHENKE